MSPRKNARRRRATDIAAPALTLVSLIPSKVKSFFGQVIGAIGGAAVCLHITYGLRELVGNLKRFTFDADVSITPFGYRKAHVSATLLLFGFGGHANVTLLESGQVIAGGAEVCTPVIDVGCSGYVNNIGGIQNHVAVNRWRAAQEAAEAAAQAKRDERNAKRRANRRKAARTTRRYR